MYFKQIKARPNWKETAASLGYLSSVFDNPPYWAEALSEPFCAVVSIEEVEEIIERATEELTEIALAVVDEVCRGKHSDKYFEQLKIPQAYRQPIRNSWERQERSLYGRFDFAYCGGTLKMLELNFDTPTSLYEASVFQWLWLEELLAQSKLPKGSDQFNSIHERLVEVFKTIQFDRSGLHLACLRDYPEDEDTVLYLESCAAAAAVKTTFMHMDELGIDESGLLVDGRGERINCLFKLYPWETLIKEDLALCGDSPLATLIRAGKTTFIEPSWKAILSNKAVLPIMWQIASGNAFLAESYLDDNSKQADSLRARPHVRKPIFGREGGSVSIQLHGQSETVSRPSQYGEEGYILQEYHKLATYHNYHVVLGSWVVDNQPAGMGMRADKNLITGNTAHFIPHYIEPAFIAA